MVRSMRSASEAMIRRFITPMLIPSIGTLRWSEGVIVEHFGDQLSAPWRTVDKAGQTQPQPSYMSGLQRTAFDD